MEPADFRIAAEINDRSHMPINNKRLKRDHCAIEGKVIVKLMYLAVRALKGFDPMKVAPPPHALGPFRLPAAPVANLRANLKRREGFKVGQYLKRNHK